MPCPSCSHENRAGAKFCEECGSPLARACASCGKALPSSAKFCDECGAPVAGGGPAVRSGASAGARKIVTIVFADLVGSTALHERLDPESARRFMESYYAATQEAVERYGGVVTQLLGDGVKAVFGIPRVAEDDAIRAVRAAVAMQEAFRALAEEQSGVVGKTGLRVAVNTGEVVANDESEIIGDPVNVAARLQEQGRDGDVVVGESTHRLVASRVTLELLGSFALKGRAQAVKAYRVTSLEAPAGAATAPFVGRDEELARIVEVYDAAVERRATCLAVLLGSPGLGKSRLIAELAHRSGDVATVVNVQCDPAGGATFAPLAEALRELLGIAAGASADDVRASIEAVLPGDDTESARIAGGVAALLSGSPAAPEETFFVVRRLLATVATDRPVLLAIDDLQWAEPLFIDLVEHLVQWGSGVSMLVLVGARPELRDLRSSFVVPGGLVTDVVGLGGLDARAAMRLAANVVGADDLPTAVAAKVLATSEGNPLFIGELVRMLADEGAITREGDRWTIGTALATFETPPTIQALLGARIERLQAEERTVLERAAVVGRHFSRSAVDALLPLEVGGLDARLESLRRSELIERDTGWFLGEPVLRFHHTLIRDVAYRRLLKGTRAELHERLADWIETRAGAEAEHDETIGRHLEQAHRLLAELGPLDPGGRRLGERAASRLGSAGRRALERDDAALAAGLLGRALDRLEADDPTRAELALDWCEALLSAGNVSAAATAIEELGRFVGGSDRLRSWHVCFEGQHTVLTAPEALRETAERVSAAAKSLASLDDAAGEAKAHYVHALALARLGEVGACEAALDHALAAARRAGDRRRANTVLAIAPLAALWGPSPVTRASGRCLDVVRVLRITQGAPAVEAVALSCQGVLEAMRGRTDAARRMIASAREMVEELGIMHRLFEVDVFGGLVALLEGDPPAAERSLRGAYEGLRDLGLGIDAARAAALLARALLAQKRVDEAEALSHESETLAGDDLKAAIAWRGVRAESLAQRGETDAAIELARAAVAIAAATDALLDHADARLSLAAALRAAGRAGEAETEERRAAELWEAKGATLLAERAERELESSGPQPILREEMAAVPAERPAERRRVRPNAATRSLERFSAALAERDGDALGRLFHDSLEVVHHPSGATYGRREMLGTWRSAMKADRLDFGQENLAILGEVLALERHVVAVEGLTEAHLADFGFTELDEISLIETDDQGRWVHVEIFAADRLHDALRRLHARHTGNSSGDGLVDRVEIFDVDCEVEALARFDELTARPVPTHRFANAMTRLNERFVAAWNAGDFDTIVALHGKNAGYDDRRRLLSMDIPRQQSMEGLRFLFDRPGSRISGAPIATRGERLAMSRTLYEADAGQEGGSIAIEYLSVGEVDADGLYGRVTLFDPTDLEAAHEELSRRYEGGEGRADAAYVAAEHEEVTASNAAAAPSNAYFENTASRVWAMFRRLWNAREEPRFAEVLAEGFHYRDHRRLYQLDLDLAGFSDFTRSLQEMRHGGESSELIATRGDRLALVRFTLEVEDDAVGPSATDSLVLVETDAQGRVSASDRYDVEDLDAAYADLDAHYVAGDGSNAYARMFEVFNIALSGRDWQAIADLYASTVVARDHRLASWGTLNGASVFVETQKAMLELAPDAQMRTDHVRIEGRAQIQQAVWFGTRDGGAFESPFVAVIEYDTSGTVARVDFYDPERIDAAFALFEEIVARTSDLARPAAHFENTAARAWAASRRTSNVCGEGGFGAGGSAELLATRGDRLALVRCALGAESDGAAASATESIVLVETDARGEISSSHRYDVEDLDAAYADLDERWLAGEAALYRKTADLVLQGFDFQNIRDWKAFTARIASSFSARDHRLLGWGTTLSNAEDFVRAQQVLIELAPDVRYRIDHVRIRGRAYLVQCVQAGTRDGGRFENPLIAVAEYDDATLLLSMDVYDLDQYDRARARFEEIGGGNAATSRDPRA